MMKRSISSETVLFLIKKSITVVCTAVLGYQIYRVCKIRIFYLSFYVDVLCVVLQDLARGQHPGHD